MSKLHDRNAPSAPPDAAAARAWVGVAGLLALAALAGAGLSSSALAGALLSSTALAGAPLSQAALDWQPARWLIEPWRAFTAIGVHYSGAHLLGNLAGVALAALLGVGARVPARLAWAWLAAWPLTQLGLLGLAPSLAHYGGLSGVLHAGVAIVVVDLLVRGSRAQRWVGAALGLGLLAKLLSETPWGPVLRVAPGWDITVAPIAHSSGAVAGVVCAGLAHSAHAWLSRRT